MFGGDRVNSQSVTARVSSLFSAQCAHDDNHNCVIVWSSGTEEQLEALIADTVPEWAALMAERADTVESKAASDRKCMLGFAQILRENGLMPSSSELIKAYNRFTEAQK